MPKLTNSRDHDYLRFDLFADDRDVNIRMQTTSLITTRAPHTCVSPIGKTHNILKGERVRFCKALVDNEWCRYWTCLPCIDAFDGPPYA